MTSPTYAITIERAPLSARFELVGPKDELSAALRAAQLPLPTRQSISATGAGDVRILWVGPRRMVVIAPLEARARLSAALRAGVPSDGGVAVADVTGATAAFLLKGSDIDAVLSQGFAHDVSPSAIDPVGFVATDGWGIAALVEHAEGGLSVAVDTSYADFFQHVLRAAAGLPTSSKPGVMRAPPPPIRTAD
jgi:heterotetrameric sarcosine oxidase gamma subunit